MVVVSLVQPSHIRCVDYALAASSYYLHDVFRAVPDCKRDHVKKPEAAGRCSRPCVFIRVGWRVPTWGGGGVTAGPEAIKTYKRPTFGSTLVGERHRRESTTAQLQQRCFVSEETCEALVRCVGLWLLRQCSLPPSRHVLLYSP